MFEIMDYRMQQHLAHELYRQQIMQRIPDPFPPAMLHFPMQQQQLFAPLCPALTGVEAKLENSALWKQFHRIGTEMIITKTGRRIFPSMRLSLAGLDEESNYCVLLEMVPIGDCRYKFSGSQWVPAGGAEPQSPQRMYLHPDSPASGSHWQAQPILFSKVKLTNNTLDTNGHTVLASMHKYQPRIHVIRASELAQIPWAPQQAFVFPETEFVAVTAYQNDRITKLKIDNNPFAKGFRETGQSRCKRKFHTSQLLDDDANDASNATSSDDEHSSVASQEFPRIKRLRAIGSHNAVAAATATATTSGMDDVASTARNLSQPPLMANAIIAPNAQPNHEINCGISVADFTHLHYTHAQHCFDAAAAAAASASWYSSAAAPAIDYSGHTLRCAPFLAHSALLAESVSDDSATATQSSAAPSAEEDFVDVVSTSATMDGMEECGPTLIALKHKQQHSFSISAILGGRQTVAV